MPPSPWSVSPTSCGTWHPPCGRQTPRHAPSRVNHSMPGSAVARGLQPKGCIPRIVTQGLRPKGCQPGVAPHGLLPKGGNLRFATQGLRPKGCDPRVATHGLQPRGCDPGVATHGLCFYPFAD
eukprot:gene18833-biopygen9981